MAETNAQNYGRKVKRKRKSRGQLLDSAFAGAGVVRLQRMIIKLYDLVDGGDMDAAEHLVALLKAGAAPKMIDVPGMDTEGPQPLVFERAKLPETGT